MTSQETKSKFNKEVSMDHQHITETVNKLYLEDYKNEI